MVSDSIECCWLARMRPKISYVSISSGGVLILLPKLVAILAWIPFLDALDMSVMCCGRKTRFPYVSPILKLATHNSGVQ